MILIGTRIYRGLNLGEDRLNIYHLCRHCAEQAEVQGLGIKVVQLHYQIF